jgi:signal transduction histidine kinase/CheY-like chemotaxis protein
VLTSHAVVAPLGWLVLIEQPLGETYAPVYASLVTTGLVLLPGLLLAVVVSLILARKMMTPIRALQAGAAQIGTGALDHRIEIDTGDELEALGNQFNHMAAQLQISYATLERKVEERTHQLELANLAKSRFLAAASHDLRQPLHALNLFVAQLRTETDPVERSGIIAHIDAAAAAMNDLFNALLDISKLDAGVLTPEVTDFPVAQLLKRIETTFVPAAREKGLRLVVVSSGAWVRSDFILLERILLNLVSNAIRYTDRGGVVVGGRRRGGQLRIEVWDSGVGIPENQRRNIFIEFYQLAASAGARRGGLGLGLAIVDRLCRLLDHQLELTSTPGRGSRFLVWVPLIATPQEPAKPTIPFVAKADPAPGKLIVVIDDDALVLDAMRGLLQSWGCRVVTAESDGEVLASLAAEDGRPDLIISDYFLAAGNTGIETIQRLRNALRAPIPAFLISGDTAPERLREATASGYDLLHKPIDPMTLRAMLNRLLKDTHVAGDRPSTTHPVTGL